MNKFLFIASLATVSLLAACATTPKSGAASTQTSTTFVAKPAAGPNISGTWALNMETPMGAREMKLTATQTGETLTGAMATERGDLPVSGTVKGKDVAFAMKVSAQGMDIQVDFVGAIEGDTMKGKTKLGEFGEGAFTGKKL